MPLASQMAFGVHIAMPHPEPASSAAAMAAVAIRPMLISPVFHPQGPPDPKS